MVCDFLSINLNIKKQTEHRLEIFDQNILSNIWQSTLGTRSNEYGTLWKSSAKMRKKNNNPSTNDVESK